MSLRSGLLVGVFLSMLAGVFQAGQRAARADDDDVSVPYACKKYECQTLHAHWDGDPTV